MSSSDDNPSRTHPSHLAASAVQQPLPRRRRDAIQHAGRVAGEAAPGEIEVVTRELQQLQAVTDTALAHLELSDLLRELLERLQTLMGVDDVAILLTEEDGQHLLLQAARGPNEAVVGRLKIPLGQGVTGHIAATRTPLVVDDLPSFEGVRPAIRERFRSVVGVPMLVEQRLVGVVCVNSTVPRHFTEADVQLLQKAADRMALAIDRARLYRAEQQAREVAEAAQARAEAALAQARGSEYRYLRLVEANIIGIAVSDAERILEANDEYLRLVGYTREDLEAGRLRYDLLKGPDAYPMSERVVQEALTVGANTPIEREYIRKDGTWVPVLVGGTLLQREPLRLVNFVLDLTERKQLETEREAMRTEAERQAEQLDRVFESIADGVGIYNIQAQPARLNAAARRILGLEPVPADYAQRPLSDRIRLLEGRDEQGRNVALEDWPLMRVLRGQASGGDLREVRLRTLDGREVELSINVAPLRDEAGNLTGAVGVFRDQTEYNRLAREQEEARAHELALEDTARHMDEFLATASHDLRTPLTVVKSQVQLALRRLTRLQERAAATPDALLDAEIQALHSSLLEANRSADRLTRLVALLFDVARARSGTLELRVASCDLAELVRRNVAAQQAAVPERRIDLKVSEEVAPVEADADRLDQVLSNYLSNALKYSPADQPVMVRLEVVENQAVVSVADHGPGLPPEEQSLIWEMFHRVPGIDVQSGSNEASGSLGLGLHICKQLIELHPGGSVGVESVVGKGSTFWFKLPVAS